MSLYNFHCICVNINANIALLDVREERNGNPIP